MVHINDLLDAELLEQMLEERFVRIRVDEHSRVKVYDYTERAQFKRVWNTVTETCRGLLVDGDTGEVLTRPLPKFFNYGETGAADLSGRPVEVYDKADGSLGLLYREPSTGELAISTRGSLRSPQALLATRVLHGKYLPQFTPNPAWSYLFEIIAPVSRVVVDYGGTEDLWLIGANDLETGLPVNFDDVAATWPGPTVQRFAYGSLLEALSAPPRTNAEGLVVLDPATGERVKIKQEDYKRLHAVITGLRKLDLWELLAVEDCADLSAKEAGRYFRMDPAAVERMRATPGAGIDGVLARVPDEMFAAVKSTIGDILRTVNDLEASFRARFAELGLADLDRKAMAVKVQAEASTKLEQTVLMGLYAGSQTTRATLWRATRPDPFDFVASAWQAASA